MNAVHFGAGNIGRGFIGLLLARSGYRVTFVDVAPDLVRQLQERGGYTVKLLAEGAPAERVEGVTALDGRDGAAVAAAVAVADLVTTSVGPLALPKIAPAIADGLRLRHGRPLHLIACENMVRASAVLRDAVLAQTGGDPLGAAFPNAVVDRIVPNYQPQPGEDPLTIAVEPYCEWLVEDAAFIAPIAPVEGMGRVGKLDAYTERKLFGLNTGHAIVAYLGHLRGHRYIHEAVHDPVVRATLLGALVEAGLALVLRHGFTEAEQTAYAAQLLQRFANAALADPVVRVGREPLRKLSPKDRLVAPALLALEQGIAPRCLARGIAAGYRFEPPEDPTGVELARRVRQEGIAQVAAQVSGAAPDSVLGRLIAQEYAMLAEGAKS